MRLNVEGGSLNNTVSAFKVTIANAGIIQRIDMIRTEKAYLENCRDFLPAALFHILILILIIAVSTRTAAPSPDFASFCRGCGTWYSGL
jgi:hypothetical protein